MVLVLPLTLQIAMFTLNMHSAFGDHPFHSEKRFLEIRKVNQNVVGKYLYPTKIMYFYRTEVLLLEELL